LASFTITGTSSVAQTLANGEVGLVTASGTLAATGTAVTISHAAAINRSSLTVLGAIQSVTDDAIASSGVIGELFVTVGSAGAVLGAALRGTLDVVTGDSVVVNNAGLMSGSFAIRVDGQTLTQSLTVLNSGTLMGTGVSSISTISTALSVENAIIVNSGTISHSDTFVRAINHESVSGQLHLTNSGTVAAVETAVRTAGKLVAVNDGSILGDVRFGLGAELDNSGVIEGDVTDSSIVGVDISTIDNGGRIGGQVTMGAGNDSLTNTGTIRGDVQMGGGSNTLGNLGGTLGGSARFGSGNARCGIRASSPGMSSSATGRTASTGGAGASLARSSAAAAPTASASTGATR
jgi:hypothetical protein